MFAESPGSSPSRKRKVREYAESEYPVSKRSHMTLRLQTPERNASIASQPKPDNEVLQTLESSKAGLEKVSGEGEPRRSPEMVASAAMRPSESPTKADSLPSTDVTVQGETSPIMGSLSDGKELGKQSNAKQTFPIESFEAGQETPRNTHEPTQSKVQKQRKKAIKTVTKDAPTAHGHRYDGHADTSSAVQTTTLPKPHAPKASTHKRFDSEEPEAIGPAEPELEAQRNTTQQSIVIEDDASDSDGAPEAITTSTSLNHAQSTAAEISKAISQKAAADKEKRRKRDEALKLQAQKSTKRAPKRKRSSSPSPEPPTQPTRLSINDPLPDLLPDYILASTPGERLLIPPPPPAPVQKQPNKLRFLDKEPRPPKDVRKGNVTIQVLESKAKQNLPPRVSKASQSLRERLLSGKKGAAQVERTSWKGTFVRR